MHLRSLALILPYPDTEDMLEFWRFITFQLDGPYNRNPDHISEIFYCTKVNSVRDQQKIDQIPEKTIYPMTIYPGASVLMTP